MLPLSYAIRNLVRFPGRLLQLVVSAAVVVGLVMVAAAFSDGMNRLLAASGSERNVILLGAGSEESVERSEIAAATAGLAAAAIPSAKSVLGLSAVSPEIHFNAPVALGGAGVRQALVRGVTPAALLVHPEVHVTEGRFPRAGEVMVGELAARKLGVSESALGVGMRILVDDTELKVVGRFAAPGTVMEAEIWSPLQDVLTIAQRETLSCVVVRTDDDSGFEQAEIFALQRLDLQLVAMRESEYYATLAGFYAPLKVMTWLTVGLIATGAVFGGLNTLHAAFASRVREMATLQAIGYSRAALLKSIIEESMLGTLTGALAALIFGLALLDGAVVSFSIGAFKLELSPSVMGAGVITGVLLGIIGAMPPAWKCLRAPLREALRSS